MSDFCSASPANSRSASTIFRPQTNRLLPFRCRAVQLRPVGSEQAKLIMRHRHIRISCHHRLQSLHCFIELISLQLDLAAEGQRFIILGVRLQCRLVQLVRFRSNGFLKSRAGRNFLNLRVLGMFLVERSVLCHGLVEIAFAK